MKQINITVITNGFLIAEAPERNLITGQPQEGKVTYCADLSVLKATLTQILSDSE